MEDHVRETLVMEEGELPKKKKSSSYLSGHDTRMDREAREMGSVVKSICKSSRRPELESQHQVAASQLSVSSVPGDGTFFCHQTCKWCTDLIRV